MKKSAQEENTASAVVLCAPMMWVQDSTARASLTDADEIRIGQVLAEQFAKEEGIAPTPQTTNIDKYLQAVGDREAANAQRKLPYQFHFDPCPSFKSAVGLLGGKSSPRAASSLISTRKFNSQRSAAIRGHEIQHVALNQCQDRLLKVLAEQHLSPQESAKSGNSKLKVDPFLDGYGHDNEFAADRPGCHACHEGCIPSGVAIRRLQTFVI